MTIPVFVWPFVAAFWIFMLWIFWMVAKTLKGVDVSLKEIARSQAKS